MTSTPLRRVQELCYEQADKYKEVEGLAIAFEFIAMHIESEIIAEKKMIVDICNECSKQIMEGSLSMGTSIGEQYYKRKYK